MAAVAAGEPGAAPRLRAAEQGAVAVTAEGRIAAVSGRGDGGDAAVAMLRQQPGWRRERLPAGRLLLPGLVDTHAHAPQYRFMGTGMDLPLLEWLEAYTFPTERKFGDVAFAAATYSAAVKRTLRCGTTTASYFGTIHEAGSEVLAATCAQAGQRALVGKVSMDRNSPDDYRERSAAEAIASAERFVEAVQAASGDAGELGALVRPVVTPRFVPTCSQELMEGLGDIATRHGLMVQSHLAESMAEIAWVAELHPEADSYADVYDRYGLMPAAGSYMAHCVHLTEAEAVLMAARGCGVAHCPSSNFALRSGAADVRQLAEWGLTVGLGTDFAGGWSPSMLDAMRMTHVAANVNAFDGGRQSAAGALSVDELLYMATQGGADVLRMGDSVGSFEVGKEFDALLVDVDAPDSPVDAFEEDGVRARLEKFVFCGDDRNIERVWVRGKLVAGTAAAAAVGA